MNVEEITLVCVAVLMGVIMIAVGCLVSKYPSLMAGYGDMKKEELDSEYFLWYRKYIKKVFLLAGYVTIAGTLLAAFIHSALLCICFIFVPIFAATILIVLKSAKVSNKHLRKAKITIPVMVICLFSVFMAIGYFSIEVKCQKANGSIAISGVYGGKIDFRDIESIMLSDTLPPIRMRVNGYALANVMVGNFRTANGHIVKLFLYSERKPYLHIRTKAGKSYYIRYKNLQKTEELYNRLIHDVQGE